MCSFRFHFDAAHIVNDDDDDDDVPSALELGGGR